jgi:hypothetical protein
MQRERLREVARRPGSHRTRFIAIVALRRELGAGAETFLGYGIACPSWCFAISEKRVASSSSLELFGGGAAVGFGAAFGSSVFAAPFGGGGALAVTGGGAGAGFGAAAERVSAFFSGFASGLVSGFASGFGSGALAVTLTGVETTMGAATLAGGGSGLTAGAGDGAAAAAAGGTASGVET